MSGLLHRLLPLLSLLSGGCYAALGPGIETPLSDTSVGTTGGVAIDTGLIADLGGAQIFASGRLGFLAGVEEQNGGPDEQFSPLVGGGVGFMVEQTPFRSNRIAWDWRVAFSLTSVLPRNSDLEKSGTFASIMIGPNFKGGQTKDDSLLNWINVGLSPGVTVSRLDLMNETTWSIGVSFKLITWMDVKYLESRSNR